MPDSSKRQLSLAALAAMRSFAEMERALGHPLGEKEREAVAKYRLKARIEKENAAAMSGAERVRAFAARGADISRLMHGVADKSRRDACEKSLVEFGVTYCSYFLQRPPSPALSAYAASLQGAIEGGGLLHVRLPRGSGKTSWIKIAIIWATLYGRLRFPVLFAATATAAQAILADIWACLESGDELEQDFPEVCVPIRALEGKTQRCASQTVGGVRTGIKFGRESIVLPSVEGSAASGAIIATRGAGSSCRGMVSGSTRPDFVLLDDIQKRSDAQSDILTRKLVDWIQSDVMGLAGAKTMSAAMSSTPIVAGDLSDIFADRAAHPEWLVVQHRLVESWPSREDLWEAYDAIWTRCMANGDSMASEATEFYVSHRADMDEGSSVLDAGNFDAEHEASAVQHARNLLLRVGRRAFDAEYQLAPMTADDVVAVTPARVMAALNGSPRRTMPRGTSEALAFVDVMADRLHYAIVAFGPHQVAAVIDYGQYPPRGRATPKDGTEREIDAAVSRCIFDLATRLYATPIHREGATPTRVHGVWFDCGWQTSAVLRTCETLRRRGMSNTYGAKGFDSVRYADGSARSVLARGNNVDIRQRFDGGRYAAQNSDYWRETAQRAFLGAPMASGSLSLWGTDSAEHFEFAAHVCAEKLAEKAEGKRFTMYRWNLKFGAANHYLDALSGCMAMASWYRFWDAADAVAEASAQTESSAPKPAKSPARKRRARFWSAR